MTYHFTVRPESGECSAEAIPMFDVDTIAVHLKNVVVLMEIYRK